MPGPEAPLWDPSAPLPADPAEAVAAVRRFLLRARAWGTDREIPRRIERLRAAATPEEAAKLHAWTTWVSFCDHALGELERGELDHWFLDGDGL